MTQRMTKERWDAVLSALSRGIDEMEAEFDDLDPDDRESYGKAEIKLGSAKEGYRILLHRRYKP